MTPQQAVEQAVKIRGHMTERDLLWLAEKAQGCKIIVEVGGLYGRSTKAMALMVQERIVTVDSFIGVPLDYTVAKLNCAEFTRNMKDEIADGKASFISLMSDDAILLLQDLLSKVDLVFIDGDHRTEQVRKDIINYLPLVRAGGIICGHDRSWPSVIKAVDELLPGWDSNGWDIWWKEKG